MRKEYRLFDKALLIVGSHETCDALFRTFSERQLVLPRLITSLEPPTEDVLSQVGFIYVYGVEHPLRLKQLEACCRYQRSFGGIDWIFGLSQRFRRLHDPTNRELARRVIDAGAEILPLFDNA